MLVRSIPFPKHLYMHDSRPSDIRSVRHGSLIALLRMLMRSAIQATCTNNPLFIYQSSYLGTNNTVDTEKEEFLQEWGQLLKADNRGWYK